MKKMSVEKKREELGEFFKYGEKKFTFDVKCHLSERVGYIYNVIFPGLAKQKFYLRHFVSRIAYFIDYSPIKCLLYRLLGVEIGKGVFISPEVVIDPHFPDLIEIGDYVIIGYGAKIFTHEFDGSTYTLGRVKIGKGAVVGGFATIRGGVEIGEMVTVPVQKIVSRDMRKIKGENSHE